jgi:hypothetical protein
MFENLIQETEKVKKNKLKGCNEPVEIYSIGKNFLRCGDIDKDSFKENDIAYCTDCSFIIRELDTKISTLKQCQTIAEEREKEIKEIISLLKTNIKLINSKTKFPKSILEDGENKWSSVEKYMFYSGKLEGINLLKQQLNPAQIKE